MRCRYEDMVRDGLAFFSRIVQSLDAKCDGARLQTILDTDAPDRRFNVGVVGRSVQLLSETNKLLLERMLMDYPQDLTELLHELPWLSTHQGRMSSPCPQVEGHSGDSQTGCPSDSVKLEKQLLGD